MGIPTFFRTPAPPSPQAAGAAEKQLSITNTCGMACQMDCALACLSNVRLSAAHMGIWEWESSYHLGGDGVSPLLDRS